MSLLLLIVYRHRKRFLKKSPPFLLFLLPIGFDFPDIWRNKFSGIKGELTLVGRGFTILYFERGEGGREEEGYLGLVNHGCLALLHTGVVNSRDLKIISAANMREIEGGTRKFSAWKRKSPPSPLSLCPLNWPSSPPSLCMLISNFPHSPRFPLYIYVSGWNWSQSRTRANWGTESGA